MAAGLSSAPWGVLEIEVPSDGADELAGSLAWFSLGVEVQPASSGSGCLLRIFFSSPERAKEAAELALKLLSGRGLDRRSANLQIAELEDGRWVENYQAQLLPFPLGEHFTVFPAVPGRPAGTRKAILLVPGRAFGTGEHATTQLCTELLEAHVAPGSHWLDLGCGTAILSIVAQHCGAAEVLAVDNDPEAVRVAAEVLRANGLDDRITVAQGTASGWADSRLDGVVANISAEFFEDNAAGFAAMLRSGGKLIASGFMAERSPAIVRALELAGLEKLASVSRKPWAALVMQRCR